MQLFSSQGLWSSKFIDDQRHLNTLELVNMVFIVYVVCVIHLLLWLFCWLINTLKFSLSEAFSDMICFMIQNQVFTLFSNNKDLVKAS